MNANWFQIVMLAYNLNCWLMLFNREEQASTADLRHTTLATARLRFLFLAAKMVRHAGAANVTLSFKLSERMIMLSVADDGTGIAAAHPAGVGLASMRERAAELGGTCVVEAGREGGTRVLARLPGLRGYVERPQHVRIRYTSDKGEVKELELKGFFATVFQHEFDHLDGKLFVDRLADTRLLAFDREFERHYL